MGKEAAEEYNTSHYPWMVVILKLKNKKYEKTIYDAVCHAHYFCGHGSNQG